MESIVNSGSVSQGRHEFKFYIRYMVSLRCRTIVRSELNKLGIDYRFLMHGAIEFPNGVSSVNKNKIKKNLKKRGIELLDCSESIVIDNIINTIIDFIHNSDHIPRFSFKEVIHENLELDDEPVLKLFTEVTGVSITNYIVYQKIERAKDMLIYDDITLPEIAEKLNYKNENYFIAQFLKFTDLHPLYFKKLKEKREKVISMN